MLESLKGQTVRSENVNWILNFLIHAISTMSFQTFYDSASQIKQEKLVLTNNFLQANGLVWVFQVKNIQVFGKQRFKKDKSGFSSLSGVSSSGALTILAGKNYKYNPIQEFCQVRILSLFEFYDLQKCIDGSLWLSLIHNFIQQNLHSGSAQGEIILTACWRFGLVRISDNDPSWK